MIDSIFNSLHLSSSQKKKKIAFKSLFGQQNLIT